MPFVVCGMNYKAVYPPYQFEEVVAAALTEEIAKNIAIVFLYGH